MRQRAELSLKMMINPLIYGLLALVAATWVFVDARRRRLREVASITDEPLGAKSRVGVTSPDADEAWDFSTQDPLRWSLFALIVPFVGLPAYFAKTKRFAAGGLAAVVVVIGFAAALRISPSVDVVEPFTPTKPIPWSRMPPGLPRAVREATEKLPTELAVQVVDILPGLVAVGKSYPGGAKIDVRPGESEAQVLLTIHNPMFIEMVAMRLFESSGAAKKVFEAEATAPKKEPRSVVIAGSERAVQIGPKLAEGASAPVHFVELVTLRRGVVMDIILQEQSVSPQPLAKHLTPSRAAALAAELEKITQKTLSAMPLAH